MSEAIKIECDRMALVTQPELFMSHDPSKIGEMVNQLGQTVEFYEHPLLGDGVPVYAKIGDVIANTGFYDTGDFFMQKRFSIWSVIDNSAKDIVIDSEYNPVLTENNEMMCYCEYESFIN